MTNQDAKTLTTRFFRSEDGATAIEYGLITALIAISIISALSAISAGLGTAFGEANEALQ